MVIGNKRKLGRKISEIQTGEKLELTETIEDKDLLLYLGLSNDNNPLFIQHDYASLTPFKKPVVPQILLMGIVTSAISKYLPGPGSSVLGTQLNFLKPVYHYAQLSFRFEVIEVNQEEHEIKIKVEAYNSESEEVLKGEVRVCPPFPQKSITAQSFENF